jgi:signal transduction histidine kinase
VRILIAEDDIASRLILQLTLETLGHQTFQAGDGETAWRIFEETEVDVIISDRMMPGIDGIQLCRLVRQHSRPTYTYFIFLTSFDDRSQLMEGMEVGADDYLPKPLDADELQVRLLVAARITALHRRLAEQTEELKQLNRLKNEFISITSHEFRTPLSTILFSAQFLERYEATAPLDKKHKHQLRIQNAVKHMTGLLNDVLIVGKADAGKLEFKPEVFDLVEFCQELATDVQSEDDKKHPISFKISIQSGGSLPRNFSGDPKLLNHIISNLLSNANKYSPEGGDINFDLIFRQDDLIFRVQDHGIGIPLEDQAHLFETFQRATNVGNISGTGLGLAIVKKCVELHGGKIWVESVVGKGTIFWVSLPLTLG